MLGALILENFKAFGKRQVIPLAPITLIFGANSSGKSSILQSLLLLKQTLAADDGADDILVPQGDLVKLGNSGEMLFGRHHSQSAEISPLFAPDQIVTEGLYRAGRLPRLRPGELLGVGVRFRFDPSTRSFVLDGVPCYCGSADLQAYSLQVVQKPLKHESEGHSGVSARLARIAGLDASHPFWSKAYTEFLPEEADAVATVLRFIGLPAESNGGGPIDPATLYLARDPIRALAGWPAELESVAEIWLQAMAKFLDRKGVEHGPPQEEIEAIKPGFPGSADSARAFLASVLDTLLGGHWADHPAEAGGVSNLLFYLQDSSWVIQIHRLVEVLCILQTIESGGDELENLLSDLHVLPDPASRDNLKGNVNLMEVRALMERRLAVLSDYSLDRFLQDVSEANSLRTFALKRFLPDRLPFPSLIDGELDAVLRAWLKGGGADSWDQLPDLTQFSLSLSQALRKELQELVYLGPLRAKPERQYFFSGNLARDVGMIGEETPKILYRRQELVDRANEWLKRLKTEYSLSVPRFEIGGYALDLDDHRGNTAVSIADVGFGIGQVLPVIVQSIMRSDSTILIEQPELHLHPRLQAELGTLFAESMAERHNQFIIETHSEHLILRLQRLIRDKKLKNSDVSVVYVMKGEDGSHCYPLRLDEEGDFIDEWPEGFFEEGYKEMFA